MHCLMRQGKLLDRVPGQCPITGRTEQALDEKSQGSKALCGGSMQRSLDCYSSTFCQGQPTNYYKSRHAGTCATLVADKQQAQT